MTSDSYFAQGAGHAICEDYALNWQNNQATLALIADGCSSSDKTDVGARIVAEVFASTVKLLTKEGLLDCSNSTIQTLVKDKIKTINSQVGLNSAAYDCTIVAALITPKNNTLQLFLWGDGVIHLIFTDKCITYSARYESNAPYYLSYDLAQNGRAEEYCKTYGKKEAKLTKTSNEHTTTLSIPPFYTEKISTQGLVAVTVFSDGISTFSKLDGDQALLIPETEIITELTNFKNSSGEFVQRRLRRFQKTCKKDNISHFDDISCASIML